MVPNSSRVAKRGSFFVKDMKICTENKENLGLVCKNL